MTTRSNAAQQGSTLLLFPAALLIMLTLAAITVDSAIAFLAQRELANATAAAANDAATRALSDRAFYENDSIELSPSEVEAVAEDRVLRLVDRFRHHGLVVSAEATPAGCSWTVTVTASSTVDEVFGQAVPGSDGQVAVRATSTASPRQGPDVC